MLEFHLSTIVWTVINLLILYLFMKKYLFGRVNAILDQRAAMVQADITAAQEEKTKAQALRADYESRMDGAAQEAAQIVSDAQTRGKRAYDEQLEAAQADVQRTQQETRTQLAAERETMLRGVRQEVAELAILAAAKVTQQSMDAKSDGLLVDSFLAEVGEGV